MAWCGEGRVEAVTAAGRTGIGSRLHELVLRDQAVHVASSFGRSWAVFMGRLIIQIPQTCRSGRRRRTGPRCPVAVEIEGSSSPASACWLWSAYRLAQPVLRSARYLSYRDRASGMFSIDPGANSRGISGYQSILEYVALNADFTWGRRGRLLMRALGRLSLGSGQMKPWQGHLPRLARVNATHELLLGAALLGCHRVFASALCIELEFPSPVGRTLEGTDPMSMGESLSTAKIFCAGGFVPNLVPREKTMIAVFLKTGIHMGRKEMVNEGDGFFPSASVVTRTRSGMGEARMWIGLGTADCGSCSSGRTVSIERHFHGGVSLPGAGYLGVRDLAMVMMRHSLVRYWDGHVTGGESVGAVIRSRSCPSAATGIRGQGVFHVEIVGPLDVVLFLERS